MKVEDFKIGVARITDVDELVKLERVTFTGDHINKVSYKRLLQRKNVKVCCVWFQGGLIGSAVIIFNKKKKDARLYNFCVTPPMQSMGIGSALLSAIEDDCFNAGYQSLTLEVSFNNLPAQLMYQARHYYVIGRYTKYYQDGSDAVRMVKMLTPVRH